MKDKSNLPSDVQNKVPDIICGFLIFQDISVVGALDDMMVNLKFNQILKSLNKHFDLNA